MNHESVKTRVEVGPADKHDAIEYFEQAGEVVLIGQRRDHHGLGARLDRESYERH